jgi:RNA polymerase sigma-70 factor (ECF subfamily)
MTRKLWPENDETEKWLTSAKVGDASAINHLLEQHRRPVRRLVEMRLDRKVQRRVDVSDVVQEVMVEASKRLQKYLENPEMAFHLWLRQIAWDHIIDTYRRHRVSAKRNMDREQPMVAAGGTDQSTLELAVQLCDPGVTPAAAATQREIAKRVEASVQLLPDQDREIITMRHYEHLTNLEISEALGLNPPAASMRYLRAIRRLRQVLDDKYEGMGDP